MVKSWPFGKLPMGEAGLVLADPPWTFSTYSAKGLKKSPQNHYDCMTLEDIKKLPVGHLCKRDAVCVIWCTGPLLPAGLATLEAWGFAYKAMGTWVKTTTSGALSMGTGYIYRGAIEPWILGTVGSPKVMSHSIRNAIVAPRREHSRKPDEMRADLLKLYRGPHIELFARETAPGWTGWGKQKTLFDEKVKK